MLRTIQSTSSRHRLAAQLLADQNVSPAVGRGKLLMRAGLKMRCVAY